MSTEQRHTPRRLRVKTVGPDLYQVVNGEGVMAFGVWAKGVRGDADVRRLIALWNACQSVSTEELEKAAEYTERTGRPPAWECMDMGPPELVWANIAQIKPAGREAP